MKSYNSTGLPFPSSNWDINMKNFPDFLAILAILFLSFSALADKKATPKPKEKVQDLAPLLLPILEKHKIPALAAAVIQGDKVVGLGAVGVRQAGGQDKVTVQDLFHLGSCTKAMTATLCAKLIEEGKLSWDLTMAKAFPDLAKEGKIHQDYQGVTLHQLLTHRGGAPQDVPDGLWNKVWLFSGSATDARAFLMEGIVAAAPAAKPGTQFIYSNAGYTIAGQMAERIMKKPWEDLMSEGIFKPLGMTSAGFGPPGSREIVDQPRGHKDPGKPVSPGQLGADNPAAIGPAGTVHCSVGDWAKFVAMHLRGDQGRNGFLKAATFTKLHTPLDDSLDKYACGWTVANRDWGGGKVLTHAGSNTMWYAVTWIAPRKDFAILVVCNQGGDPGAKATDEAASALIQDHLKQRKKE